ncbi:MAG: hypothetical protein O9320_08625 [Magnetospirillum sp.]|nr:hypothetical protein [Magnetospirillum sp.]
MTDDELSAHQNYLWSIFFSVVCAAACCAAIAGAARFIAMLFGM